MLRHLMSRVVAILAVAVTLTLASGTAHAWGWRGGYCGGYGGYGWYGGYGGWGRPYYGYGPAWGYGGWYRPWGFAGYWPAYSYASYGYGYPYGYGYGYGYPYLAYGSAASPVVVASGVTTPAATVPATVAGESTAHLRLRLPADAVVWANGVRMGETGPVRTFDTPPLRPGKDYYYDIRVRWPNPAGAQELTRTVRVRPDDTTVVDFTTTPVSEEMHPVSTER